MGLATCGVALAGTGTVTVREVERSGRRGIEIICEDQGPGIANIDVVMQDGYSTSRGMGMGLPICKRIVETTGGSMWIEDSPEGLDVRFTLPIGPSEGIVLPASDEVTS